MNDKPSPRTLTVEVMETGRVLKTVDVTGWKEMDILTKEAELSSQAGSDCAVIDSGASE